MSRLIFLFLTLFSCGMLSAQDKHADIILINGKIWTGVSANSFVQALAIKGNKIMAVGTTAKILTLAGPGTRRMELANRLVIPGFNDAHIHFLSGSTVLSNVDLLATTSLDEMKKIILDYAANNPNKQWLSGRGWQYGFFDGGMPDKKHLDSLVPDRPVFLSAYDGHTGLANSKALELAGINRNTSFTGFGEIVKDANGEPTGALLEGAQGLVRKVIPETTVEDQLAALRNGLRYAASLGITSMQNANGDVAEYELFNTLYKKGELTVRYTMAFNVGPRTTQEEIKEFTRLKNSSPDPSILKGHAIKFMLDGVIESHTAVMLQPYSDISLDDRMQHKKYGMPLEQYNYFVKLLDKEGFQLYTHAIGDGAVREVLNAYENAMKVNGKKERRHRVEHIEQVSSTDIPRFAKLGVLASMQPIHADPGTVDVWSKAVGEERLPRSFAWQSLLKSGATLVYGADWPACISLNPIRGIHNAVNRTTINGQPPGGWVPAQRISIAEALKAYTVTGAYASFDEKQKGMLLPGYLADLVVLSKDLFTIPEADIHKTVVDFTMVNGKDVYMRNF